MATGTSHGISTGPGAPREPGENAGSAPRQQGGWTAGRVISVVIGSLLALVSLGLLGSGGTLMWADQSLRQDGFVTTGTATYSTAGYALASEHVNLGWGWLLSGVVGDVRLRVTAAGAGSPVFVAIGPAGRVSAYLSGTAYTTTRASPPRGCSGWRSS